MSAMIDVVFLLLIYFIMTQKEEISEAHLAVNMPAPSQQQEKIKEPKLIEIEVHAGGRYMVKGRTIPISQIEQFLKQQAQLDPDTDIRILTSVRATTADLVKILDICNGAGLTKLNLNTLL